MRVISATGQLVSDFLGCECSGVVAKLGRNVTHLKEGDRVCKYMPDSVPPLTEETGMADVRHKGAWTLGAYSTHIRNPGVLVQGIPDDMSFEVAASIPAVYTTAYLSLIDTAHLQKGETILIHAAAGGVGQAAIMLSAVIGAEIFVTVGALEKKLFLMENYGIPEDHIFSSRDSTFAQGILRVTKGKGVDVVLNCLAGELLRETWNCIAMFGRFVEIGKRDIEINAKLDMEPFKRNVAFSSVDLSLIFSHKQSLGARAFADAMDLLRKNSIRPVTPLTTYPIAEVESAYRFMQAGKHFGKIVLTHNPDAIVKVISLTH
jgi:NADPH:quinone reductase-like Zn-dependent oxidoreductase